MTSDVSPINGALAGLKVLEIGSLGPGPFCAMALADHGADVLRIDRGQPTPVAGPAVDPRSELLHRGRKSAAVDLKSPRGAALVLELVEQADVLLEGFRPGVAERLGVGPDVCIARNPRLIYGRMTGYGQDGPEAQTAGHDLNYLARSGVLSLIGRAGEPPAIPLNLLADMGGGGLLMAVGLLMALHERTTSGRGQIVDASMVDGVALLATALSGWVDAGVWSLERGTNLLDGGSPYCDVYETSDGKWLSVAALEERFYDGLLDVLELEPSELPLRSDKQSWPVLRERFAGAIRARDLADWTARIQGRDVCVAPVVDFAEVAADPHLSHRGTYQVIDDILQPTPAPRLSRTPGSVRRPPPRPGEHTAEALRDWGVTSEQLVELQSAGVVIQTSEQRE